MALTQAGSFYKTPFGLSLSKRPYDEAPREAFDKLRQNGRGRQGLTQAGSFYKTPFGLSLSKPVLSLSKRPVLSLSNRPVLSLSKRPYDEAPRKAFDKLRPNGRDRQGLE